ncbi:S9 family peptidase, partial [candidate division KSB1 bacterium]|nr:S9 family peptidase [candidate division KSB1 bacterium]NIR72790.1 S9 family peptidase [candidate division KSB1 bacterium]NIS26835.1 S9 family peptidase [candidate division KSB1 bacterium]NIT73630.1 S9 family peptidase [candidate division KSB1 bacterium]NIU27502.1 S9 family peptidase [candidate division KSB1 bacterium]
RLAMLRLNRLQNKVEILVGDITTGETKVIFTETDERWLEIEDGDWHFLKKQPRFIWTSERDGYNHIYLYDSNGELVRQITKGNWVVRRVVAVEEEKERIYFTATKKSPLENHLYRIGFDGTGLTRISQSPGWHSIEFSPTHETYIDHFSAADTPTKVGLFTSEGERIDILVENKLGLKDYEFSPPEFFSFETTDGISLNAWMIKPADFDQTQKYPVLMYVYGGPGSQTVRNSWGRGGLWYQLLAQKGYIVTSVDNRGTGGRGAEFKKMTYKNLGHWEVHDQIEAAEYFGSLSYIDKERIGIFGWSYGGYMASFCLFKGNDVFKMAISGAPVTHWRFYDTIYTERYMQTPQLNPKGYEGSAPLNYTKNLQGKLLLIHGTADDNVHFQNSVKLVEELVKHNKQFQTMYYPGEYHGVRQGKLHLYTMMTDFILKNL